jgi:hypothetical protein
LWTTLDYKLMMAGLAQKDMYVPIVGDKAQSKHVVGLFSLKNPPDCFSNFCGGVGSCEMAFVTINLDGTALPSIITSDGFTFEGENGQRQDVRDQQRCAQRSEHLRD